MTLEASIRRVRRRVVARVQELGNVSQACREFGISRTLFYRWRERYLAYGPDGLHPRRQGAGRGRPSRLGPQHDLSPAAPQRFADALGAPGGARAPQRAGRRSAHRAHSAPAGCRSAASGAAQSGEQAWPARRLGTFYIDKLKGAGKVWQYTACDAACSFAVAQVSPAFSAAAAARFLTHCRQSGLPVGRCDAS